MNRFDEILKAKLDSHEAPLDMGMWNAIEQKMAAPASSASSFNASLIGGIAATTLLVLLFTSLPTLENHEAIATDTPEQGETKTITPESEEKAIATIFQEQESHEIEFKNSKIELKESSVEVAIDVQELSSREAADSEVEEFIEEPILTADFSASGIQCPGSEITFNALKTEGTITWLFDGVHVKDGTSASYLFESAGTHEVVMMTEFNGKTVSVNKSIEIFEAPSFKVFSMIDKGTDCLTSDVFLSTEPTDYTYEWSLDGERGEGEEINYQLLAGTYMATVKGISAAGCVGIVNHPVLVKDEIGIYIPNSFAPDGDGMNDVWKPVGLLGDHKYELSIYSVPEQELVYQSKESIEWDGTKNGMKLPARKSYLYKLKITDSCGNSETKSGNLNAVR